MRNYVIINGVNSLTIQGLAIKTLPPITKPIQRNLREEIDGRDGDIVTTLGYGAYDKTIEIGLFGTFDIDEVIAYFNQKGTITFSNESDKVYYFEALDQVDYAELLKFRTANVVLHCQPFKYPLNETPLVEEYEYVEATGTNLTLNNTAEAIFNKIDLIGNTEQTQYTGKNIFNTQNYFNYQVNSTMISDNSLKVISTGTQTNRGVNVYPLDANGNKILITDILNKTIRMTSNISSSTLNTNKPYYTISRGNGGAGTQDKARGEASGTLIDFTFTTNDSTYPYLCFYFMHSSSTGSVAVGNETTFSDIIVTIDNSNMDYEPYVGGIPAPNPSFPQDVHVVSGDNVVEIIGTNLFDIESFFQQANAPYTRNEDGSYTFSSITAMYNTTFYINPTDRVIFSYKITNGNGTNFRFRFIYEDGFINETTGSGTETGEVSVATSSSTTHGKVVGIRGNWSNAGSFTIKEPMLEQYIYGVSPRPYEPYQKQVYPINLGVENLLENTATTQTISGITFTKNEDGSVLVNGTATATINTYKIATISLGAGTYTLSGCPSSGSTSTYRLVETNAFFDDRGSGSTKEVSSTTSYSFYIQIYNGAVCNNLLFKPQLEKGSKVNSFTPYGTTPIELCGINTYQDYFTKNNGNNLFDEEYEYGSINYDTGELETTNNIIRTKNYQSVEPSTQYTIRVPNEVTGVIFYYYNNGTFISGYQPSLPSNKIATIVTNPNANQVKWRFNSSYTTLVNRTMFSKGYTPQPYEPHGTGLWCKYNAIGKVVLNGSETGWVNDGGGAPYKYVISDIKNPPSNAYTEVYCDNYYPIPYNDNWSNYDYLITRPQYTSTTQGVKFKNKDISSLNDFKTWLSTNNTKVLYILATPYLSLVEDTNLISQLDNIQNATSYKGQTNITQTNNDLPFIMEVSTMELGSDTITIDNIGNIYSKPTLDLEGTGIVDIYLNDTQMFEVDLSEKNEIVIDTEKMEAYNPTDNTLANRQVTGDYSKFKLDSGENDLRFSGDLTKATITNYERWL